ncbi:MAG: HupE/UreJ family protein [Halieaceae bacterium]|nr:HupE/UreJ family protein [Halieaceae bacterium]
MTRPALLIPLATVLLALPEVAQAHLVTSGLGPFYDGALHLLLSPADLLGLIAAALLAGLRGRRAARMTVIALPLAWLCAGLVGLRVSGTPDLAWLSTLSFMLLGLLVAANVRLPPIAVALLAGAFGALQGLESGSVLATLGSGATSLAGMVLAVLLLALLTSAAVAPLQAFWARVAVRVAGSWVVAVGILMLGWMFQGAA